MKFPAVLACSLAVLAATAPITTAGTVVGIGNGGNIPANAPIASAGDFTSDIVIPAGGIVAPGNAVTVILKGLNHGWSGDLIATLSYIDSEGNTICSANLFSRPARTSDRPSGAWAQFGAAGPTGDNYWFNSDFTGDLSAVASTLGFADFIPGEQGDPNNYGRFFTTDAGTVKNSFSYSFTGLDVSAGTWRLTITDASDHGFGAGALGDIGSLIGWELDIQIADLSAITSRARSPKH